MAKTRPQISAERIEQLLAEKHKRGLFVAQCKNGPTWSADNLRILDAWAVRPTWSPWTTVGYEIKIARSDFEQDQKWPDYLEYCHEFSFVCPTGLIKRADLPDGVGLIWCSANGGRLYTKVKAARHEPSYDKLVQLMSYVLLHRVETHQERPLDVEQSRDERMARHRQIVEQAEQRKQLAYFIGGHIRAVYERVDREALQTAEQQREVREFSTRLAQLGITWNVDDNSWSHRMDVDRQIDRLDGGLSPMTRTKLRRAAAVLVRVLDDIEQDCEPSGIGHPQHQRGPCIRRQPEGESEPNSSRHP